MHSKKKVRLICWVRTDTPLISMSHEGGACAFLMFMNYRTFRRGAPPAARPHALSGSGREMGGAAAWLGYPFAVCDPDLRVRSSVSHLAHSSF